MTLNDLRLAAAEFSGEATISILSTAPLLHRLLLLALHFECRMSGAGEVDLAHLHSRARGFLGVHIPSSTLNASKQLRDKAGLWAGDFTGSAPVGAGDSHHPPGYTASSTAAPAQVPSARSSGGGSSSTGSSSAVMGGGVIMPWLDGPGGAITMPRAESSTGPPSSSSSSAAAASAAVGIRSATKHSHWNYTMASYSLLLQRFPACGGAWLEAAHSLHSQRIVNLVYPRPMGRGEPGIGPRSCWPKVSLCVPSDTLAMALAHDLLFQQVEKSS